MVHNRNKLIELFIGNLSNAIIHKVLEKATDDESLSNKYDKELTTSWEIAKKYREKINPRTEPLPIKDIEYIKQKIIKRVKAELSLRIIKGYSNIDLALIENIVNNLLRELSIV